MKNLSKLFLLAAICACLAACDDNGTTTLPPYENEASSSLWFYRGTINIAGQADGSTYTEKDLVVKLVFDEKREKCNIVMYNAKFASAMPFRLDIVISGADVTKTASGYRITGNNIIPTYNKGTEVAEYTLTGLVIDATATAMTLTSDFGKFPVDYTATGYDSRGGSYGKEGEDFDDDDEDLGTSWKTYSGNMDTAGSGGTYTKEGQKIEVFFPKGTETKCNIVLYDAKFAERMPPQTIVVKGVTCTKGTDGYEITANGIVPTVGGEPYPDFTVTGLSGLFNQDNMGITMKCGSYPVEYYGDSTNE